jgi:hypothetical protein
MTQFSMTTATNLMTDIDKRFDATAIQSPVRYISADEMAYLRSRAVTLRNEAGKAFFDSIASGLSGLFRSRTDWSHTPAVTAK